MHRKLWGWVYVQGKETLTKNKNRNKKILLCKSAAGRHSLNYPPSFIFRYHERLVRSLVYLPSHSRQSISGDHKSNRPVPRESQMLWCRWTCRLQGFRLVKTQLYQSQQGDSTKVLLQETGASA